MKTDRRTRRRGPGAASACVLLRPLARGLVVLGLVLQEQLCDLRHERIVRAGIRQQGGDGEQHLGDGEGRAPLVPQDVEADRPARADIAVVDLRREVELLVRREVDLQEEDGPGVGGVRRAHDRGLPAEHVVAGGPRGAACRRVVAQVRELLLNALEGHVCTSTF